MKHFNTYNQCSTYYLNSKEYDHLLFLHTITVGNDSVQF